MTESLSAADFAARYDLDVALVEKAYGNLASGKAILLGVSGRLGAGKDTVAPLLMEKLGHPDAIHVFFARPLKEEATKAIELIAESNSPDEAARVIHLEQGVSYEKALLIAERLWLDVKVNGVRTAYTRTDGTRFALQYWGTEIRRAQDEAYWVKRAIAAAVDTLAEGKSTFVTDARYQNEIDSIQGLGGKTVRLKVSPEEQRKRITNRDGIAPTEEALTHASELALDDYEESDDFTVVIDTDKLTLEEVVEEAAAGIVRQKSKQEVAA